MLNRLKAGHHLKEMEVSEQLNVSRGPMREAFTSLPNENLVEKRGNGRTVVKEYTKKDIKDLYHARILLENAALAEISAADFQKHLKKFHFYLQKMEDKNEKNLADMAFHKLIIELS